MTNRAICHKYPCLEVQIATCGKDNVFVHVVNAADILYSLNNKLLVQHPQVCPVFLGPPRFPAPRTPVPRAPAAPIPVDRRNRDGNVISQI